MCRAAAVRRVVAHRPFSRRSLLSGHGFRVYQYFITFLEGAGEPKHLCALCSSSGPALTTQTRAYNWRRGGDRSDHPLQGTRVIKR